MSQLTASVSGGVNDQRRLAAVFVLNEVLGRALFDLQHQQSAVDYGHQGQVIGETVFSDVGRKFTVQLHALDALGAVVQLQLKRHLQPRRQFAQEMKSVPMRNSLPWRCNSSKRGDVSPQAQTPGSQRPVSPIS